ncbi:glycosyltransferase family 4 protein [Blastococcus sp. Marseille-P5729]|uniref:glycosyltransferase family 4 protein n=1 Tax=Blastococcus sp. Marseille-P5729 TaxID=2086582 RepID=UPI000D10546F|nr:glycosyltransferase family 4 protein [Blastococcus sp. Marseille-P5729]
MKRVAKLSRSARSVDENGVAEKRRTVLFGVTAPETALAFLDGQLAFLSANGLATHLASSADAQLREMARQNSAVVHHIPIERSPSFLADFRALLRVIAVVRRVRPDVSVMGTPKMGLLGSIACRVSGVPRRVYLLHGLRYEGLSGAGRQLLILIERLVCLLSTDVVAVSPSVRNRVIADRLAPAAKVQVLGYGSANGVDVEAFRPAEASEKREARAKLGIPHHLPVVLFVGRLNRDKGLRALVAVAKRLALTKSATLAVAGALEPYDRADIVQIQVLLSTPSVAYLGRRDDVADVFRASDLLILPTRREGLPTVVLEAAACGLPVIASAATGTVDAVIDGVTGWTVPQGNDQEFAARVSAWLERDIDQDRAAGRAGRQMIIDRFVRERVWTKWREFLELREGA